jgi:hypothetical protein
MDGVEFCKIEPPSPGKFLETQVTATLFIHIELLNDYYAIEF